MKGNTRKFTSQEGAFLNFLRPLIPACLPLITNVLLSVLTPFSKTVLLPLGVTAGASKTNAAIPNKYYGFGTTLVPSDEETEDIIKIRKSFEDAGLFIKGIREIVGN